MWQNGELGVEEGGPRRKDDWIFQSKMAVPGTKS